MELSAVGERVFAAESIIKRRIRKVRGPWFHQNVNQNAAFVILMSPCKLSHACCVSDGMQGRLEYLVKWKGWSPK